MFPFLISATINSSIIKQDFAKLTASFLNSLSVSSVYSSLNVSIPEGSIPISGVFSEITSFNIPTFLFAIFFALLINPLDKNVLPLKVCFGISTLYPRLRNNFTAVIPIFTSL